jgi:histone H3/H4
MPSSKKTPIPPPSAVEVEPPSDLEEDDEEVEVGEEDNEESGSSSEGESGSEGEESESEGEESGEEGEGEHKKTKSKDKSKIASSSSTEHVHKHKTAAAIRRRHAANVRHDQINSVNLFIPKRPLKRLVRAAITRIQQDDDVRIQAGAFTMLHQATEAHLKSIFALLNVLASDQQNKTVLTRHFKCLMNMRVCGVTYPVQITK